MANNLGYAQSSITSHIQPLEKELDVLLFERIGNNIQTIKQLVILGFGVAFLPRFAVIQELKTNQLTELSRSDTDFDVMIQVVCHKDKWISSTLKEFIKIIKENGL